MLRAAANPILISLEYDLRSYRAGESFSASVWIVNDRGTPYSDCAAEIHLGGVKVYSARVEIGPASAQKIGSFTVELPKESLRVDCRLAQLNAVLSENAYDLNDYDGRWILRARLKQLELRQRGLPG